MDTVGLAAAPSSYARVEDGVAAALSLADQGQPDAALALVQDVQAAFPDKPHGFLAAADLCQRLGRLDEADSTLTDGQARFPDQAGFAVNLGWLKARRGDFGGAVAQWAHVRQTFPTVTAGYLGGAAALRQMKRLDDAEALLATAVRLFPKEAGVLIEYAWIAHHRRDWDAALDRWAILRITFPDHPAGCSGTAATLSERGQWEEAEACLAAGIQIHPDDRGIAIEFARLAHRRKDWDTAIDRWASLRTRFPDWPAGFTGGAETLRDAGQPEPAEALLQSAVNRWPDDEGLAVTCAWLAYHQRDWPEAARRWATVRLRFPGNRNGYLVGARALRAGGQAEQATALLDQARLRWPDDPEIFDLAAEIVSAAGRPRGQDGPARIEQARRLAEQFPDRVEGAVGYAEALSVEGRHDMAEAILLDAQRRFPDRLEPFAAYAQVAIRRGAWAASLERWQEAQRRFPDKPDLSHRVFEARMRVAEVDPDSVADVADAAPADAAPEMKDIVKDFESLGGAGHGCEFGLFQRAFGAEPLGLLRWADLGSDLLIDALEAKFEGVGEPEHTLVFTPGDTGRLEYWTRDKRYWMAMRCFIMADEVPYEKMVTQACRRIQFLRRKLIDDLSAGEKIFVFKSIARNLTDQELGRLHRSVRGYGDNTLLYVRYEDDANPNGTVRVAGPGLMIGYVDRFAFSPEDKDLGPAVDRWAEVCGKAHAIWLAGGKRVGQGTVDLPSLPVSPTPAVSQPEPSRGQRLIEGPCVTEPPIVLAWSDDKKAELERTVAEKPANTREHAYAMLLLETLAGNRESARRRIGKLADDFAHLYPHDAYTFEVLILGSILSGQWDIAPRLLRDRFGADWCAAVDVDPATPDLTVRWEIDANGKSRFHFNQGIFTTDRGWIELLFWLRSTSLFHDYSTAPTPERGSVMVAIADAGATPGLAGSAHPPGYHLIPDSQFLDTNGYASLRASFEQEQVPWDARKPMAFWRGASTGSLRGDWRNMQRIKLCLIARTPEAAALIDAGITSLVNLPADMLREAEAADIRGDFVSPAAFNKYKYQIDIDGNVNAWQGLFQKLLSGNPVLKVRSPLDYRQWYYDDLIPWTNYVPVETEMDDLLEKIAWLRVHDGAARRIGEAGQALVRSLTRHNELRRIRPVISAAIRYFAGRPEIVIPLDAETAESRFLTDGWSGLVTVAGRAGRYALAPESRIRFPRPISQGTLSLRLTLAGSKAARPFHMITIVNGVPVSDVIVAAPGTVVSTVPGPVVDRASQTAITLLFPDLREGEHHGLPAGSAMTGLLFTRVELAVA